MIKYVKLWENYEYARGSERERLTDRETVNANRGEIMKS